MSENKSLNESNDLLLPSIPVEDETTRNDKIITNLEGCYNKLCDTYESLNRLLLIGDREQGEEIKKLKQELSSLKNILLDLHSKVDLVEDKETAIKNLQHEYDLLKEDHLRVNVDAHKFFKELNDLKDEYNQFKNKYMLLEQHNKMLKVQFEQLEEYMNTCASKSSQDIVTGKYILNENIIKIAVINEYARVPDLLKHTIFNAQVNSVSEPRASLIYSKINFFKLIDYIVWQFCANVLNIIVVRKQTTKNIFDSTKAEYRCRYWNAMRIKCNFKILARYYQPDALSGERLALILYNQKCKHCTANEPKFWALSRQKQIPLSRKLDLKNLKNDYVYISGNCSSFSIESSSADSVACSSSSIGGGGGSSSSCGSSEKANDENELNENDEKFDLKLIKEETKEDDDEIIWLS